MNKMCKIRKKFCEEITAQLKIQHNVIGYKLHNVLSDKMDNKYLIKDLWREVQIQTVENVQDRICLIED